MSENPPIDSLISAISFYERLASAEIAKVVAFENDNREVMSCVFKKLLSSLGNTWSLGGWLILDGRLVLRVEIKDLYSSPDIHFIEMTPDWQAGKPQWADDMIQGYQQQYAILNPDVSLISIS
ncbi:hypothetical protein D3C87_347730 [compost metagenome]